MQRLAMPCLESMGSGHPSVVQRLEYRKRVFLTIVLTAGLLALLAAAIPRVGAVPALAFVSPLAPVNNSRRLNGRQIDTACGWINKGEECCPWGQICPAGSECYSTGQMSTRRCRVAGQSCPSGQRFCSFVCTNLDTSMNNCGSCGHTCGGSSEADWYCSGGECKYSCKPPVCAPGQMVASAMAMCPYCVSYV
ncbi:hypothetical protein DFJ74DRAFT_102683 [Hyaloraphidium curvatum]|nr:hypothetical protein DFJ74DRAFT_102683 [Hyaloraphidium curvatum]